MDYSWLHHNPILTSSPSSLVCFTVSSVWRVICKKWQLKQVQKIVKKIQHKQEMLWRPTHWDHLNSWHLPSKKNLFNSWVSVLFSISPLNQEVLFGANEWDISYQIVGPSLSLEHKDQKEAPQQEYKPVWQLVQIFIGLYKDDLQKKTNFSSILIFFIWNYPYV